VARRPGLLLALLLAVTAGACLPAIDAPFTFDERAGILDNRAVHPGADLGQALSYRFSPDQMRPLFFASLWLDSQRQGLGPRGFHVTNLLLHLACGGLVFVLARRALRRTSSGAAAGDGVDAASLAGAAVFLLHPLQSESIIYIWGRAGILETLLALLAIGLVPWPGDARRPAPAGEVIDALRWIAAPFAAALALASKEDAVALPVTALVVWIVLERRPWRGAVARAAILALPVGLFLALRAVALGAVGRQVFARSAADNLLVQGTVTLRFLGMALVPHGQSVDHAQAVPGLLPGLLAIVCCLALVIAAALVVIRSAAPGSPAQERRRVAARLGSGGLLIAASGMVLFWVVPVADVMPERRVYPMMLGAAYAVTGAASLVRPRLWPVILLMALLAPALAVRARLWSHPDALWEEAARRYPLRARPLINLGVNAAERGDLGRAAQLFDRAVILEPRAAEALYNRGLLRLDQGNLEGALSDLEASTGADPTVPKSWINLGIVHLRRGENAAAEDAFRKALAIDPDDPRALTNLGELARAAGRDEDAIDLYRRALAVDPLYAHAAGRLGVTLEGRGDRRGALAAYREYLRRGAASAADRAAVEEKIRSLESALAAPGTIR
jgi:Tfp pilus assembly protein PilF